MEAHTCRDECPNSRLCNKPCPKSGDYMDCCEYWHFEEMREDARREEAYFANLGDYDDDEQEDDEE